MHRLERTGKLKYGGLPVPMTCLHNACIVGPVTTSDTPPFFSVQINVIRMILL